MTLTAHSAEQYCRTITTTISQSFSCYILGKFFLLPCNLGAAVLMCILAIRVYMRAALQGLIWT